MRIPSRVIRALFIASNVMCLAVLLCFAMRDPIAHHWGYESAVWRSCSVLARSLLLIIPVVLGIYFACSDRKRVLTFHPTNRMQDASAMFLMGFWMLLAVGFLLISWVVKVSTALD